MVTHHELLKGKWCTEKYQEIYVKILVENIVNNSDHSVSIKIHANENRCSHLGSSGE